jgi:cytochrome c peroxidase
MKVGTILVGLMVGLSPWLAWAEPTVEVPRALLWDQDDRLLVGTLRSIVVVDSADWTIRERWPVPAGVVSLAELADSLVAGTTDGRAVVFAPSGRLLRTVEIGRGPVGVVAVTDQRFAAACRWDECVRIVDGPSGAVVADHPLSFAPGAMVARPDGRLIVADTFGPNLVDLVPGRLGTERHRTLDGFQLHALAVAPGGRELLVGHQEQYQPMPVTSTNIDWGLVLSSRLSAVRLPEFDREAPAGSPLPRRRLGLDGSRHGAADPSALAVSADGRFLLVALAGAHQVLKSDRGRSTTDPRGEEPPLGDSQRLQTVEVGQSPVALVIDPTGTRFVTADAMSDTLSVVHLSDLTVQATVVLGDGSAAGTAEQRGEALFRDGRRSLDRWMSCSSCHTEGHTCGLNFDTLGDGSYGAAKNTPSLLGVGRTPPYTWTGRFDRLKDQVHQSLRTSLRGPAPSAEEVDDLVAYLSSLQPPPPRRSPDASVDRGALLFRQYRCDRCHPGPTFTVSGARDPELGGVPGLESYNPPSLRGISRSAPYLHDGRARSLADVLAVHHPGSSPLAPRDLTDLIAFLESL